MDYDENKLLKLLFVNSLVAFYLAFLFIFIFSQILIHFTASFFHIPTQFNRFQLIFPILDHSYLWTQLSVSVIYSVTPIFSFIIAIVARIIFLRRHTRFSISKNVLLIWLNAHGFNFFFGALVVGIPIVQDFGYIPDWLYFPEWIKFGLITLSLIILLHNGKFIRHALELFYFDEKQQNKPYYSFLFKWYIAIAPALVSLTVLIIFGLPTHTLYMRLFLAIFIIQLFAVIPFYTVYKPIEIETNQIYFDRKMVFLLLLLIVILYIWKQWHITIFPIPAEYLSVFTYQNLKITWL